MRIAFAVVLVTSLVTAPGLALAAKESLTAQAKRHFKQGREFYVQARYRDAIAEFEAAYQAKPHGVIFFNLAQCYEKLGDVPNAIKHYRQYLQEIPQAEDRPAVETVVANLEQRLKDAELQPLVIDTRPSGADLQLDGESKGKTPFNGRVKAGWHNVAVKLDGHEPVSRLVSTSANQPTQLDIPLVPIAAPVAATRVTAAPAAPRSVRQNKWTWASFGVAGIATGAALLAGISANARAAELRGMDNRSQADVQRLHDSALRRARTANILYGIGGVAAAAGVTLYIVDKRF